MKAHREKHWIGYKVTSRNGSSVWRKNRTSAGHMATLGRKSATVQDTIVQMALQIAYGIPNKVREMSSEFAAARRAKFDAVLLLRTYGTTDQLRAGLMFRTTRKRMSANQQPGKRCLNHAGQARLKILRQRARDRRGSTIPR